MKLTQKWRDDRNVGNPKETIEDVGKLIGRSDQIRGLMVKLP